VADDVATPTFLWLFSGIIERFRFLPPCPSRQKHFAPGMARN
jgi:hypothetical protein